MMSEAFHDVLGYKPPQMYKVPLATSEADHAFAVETLSRIGNSYNRFLRGPASDLTAPEAVYHDMVGLLSTLVPLCASGAGAGRSLDAAIFGELTDAVAAGLDSLRDLVPAPASEDVPQDVEATMALLGSLHTVGVYREAATAVSLATAWILGVNERAKARDRSGQSNLPKEVVSRTKALQTAAESALGQGRKWIEGLRAATSKDKSGFQRRLSEWLLDGAEALRDVAYEEVVPGLVGNVVDNVDGWQQVKWVG